MAERPEAGRIEAEEMDSVELPAPAGWKKFIPKNSDIPKRNDVLFISPTGEEIRSRKLLNMFLRSHPGGPLPSEFDWTFGTPRRSARISKKTKATESPEEGPSKKREKRSNSNKGTKLKEKGGDTEGEENEVPENEKTDRQVESIVDAEMNDVEDSSLKEKPESAAKIIEEVEVKTKVSDQDSGESQDEMNKNEPEKMQPEDSNINGPALSAPEATEQNSAACENQEKLEVEVVSKDMPEKISAVNQNHEKNLVEGTNKCELVLNEATKEENSGASTNLENPQVDVRSEDVSFLNKLLESKEENSAANENQVKLGVKDASNGAHVLSVPIETKDEAVATRKTPEYPEVSTQKAEPIKEDLREKEMKDRTFLNDSRKWEQKKVSSS